MEYKQDDFYKMRNGNTPKMPFYMTYPMQNIFLEEAEYERDMQRLKQMYPEEVRKIQELVEEECDRMEYEGSLMFDEYPDRLMLRQICRQISDKMDNSVDFEAEQYEVMEAEEVDVEDQQFRSGPPPFGPPPRPGQRPPQRPGNGWDNLIEVLLFNEMYNRRCRHRRCRRWW